MEEAHPLPDEAFTRLETSTASADVRRIWAYRIPSLLGAMLAAATCAWGTAKSCA